MILEKVLLSEPIKPYINEDGYYPQCACCYTELEAEQEICPKCNQKQDWSWLRKYKNKTE